MKSHLPISTALIVVAMFAAGCASTSPPPPYPSQSYPSQNRDNGYRSSSNGTVDRIEVVNKGDANNIAGTIIGGIVGGLIGHQIGGGSGQTAATVVGAAGGAVAGNQVEKRSRGATETFRVSVRMDDGSYQTITQDDIIDLRSGDRVRIENGHIYRS